MMSLSLHYWFLSLIADIGFIYYRRFGLDYHIWSAFSSYYWCHIFTPLIFSLHYARLAFIFWLLISFLICAAPFRCCHCHFISLITDIITTSSVWYYIGIDYFFICHWLLIFHHCWFLCHHSFSPLIDISLHSCHIFLNIFLIITITMPLPQAFVRDRLLRPVIVFFRLLSSSRYAAKDICAPVPCTRRGEA